MVLKQHAVVEHLWVCKHLRQVENRTTWDALARQGGHPNAGRLAAKLGVEDVSQRLAMRGPQARGGKTTINPQFPQIESRTETPKRLIRPGGNIDIPVLCFESPRRSQVMQMIAHRGY